MLELQEMLQTDDSSCIYGFFHRSDDELMDQKAEFCAIESNIEDLSLPCVSDVTIEAILVDNIDNIQKPSSDMVQKIKQREEERKLKKRNLDIQVEHKFIDFSYLILGNKIRNPGENYSLDNYKLTELMLQGEEGLAFYNQEFVKKIIDIQFPLTRKFYISLLFIYFTCFFCPFMTTSVRDGHD